MKKPFIKILTILSIIFISFFVGKNGAFADENNWWHCNYISPLTFLNNDGSRATRVDIRFSYVQQYENQTLFWKTKSQFIEKTRLTMSAFCLDASASSKENRYAPGFKTIKPLIDNTEGVTNINQSIFMFNPTYSANKVEFEDSPEYVKVYIDGKKLKSKKSTREEYINYLKNVQYSGVKEGDYYSYITFDDGWGASAGIYDDKNNIVAVPIFDTSSSLNDGFYSMLKKLGGEVVLFKTTASTYPSENMNLFNKALSDAEKKGNKEEKIKNAKEGLESIIDTGDSDTKTKDSTFYENTKGKWYEFIKNDMKNPTVASPTKKTYFSYWFSLTGRYIFEDDLNLFLEYLDFMKDAYELDDADFALTKDQYSDLREMIVAMIKYSEKTNESISITNDSCKSLCSSCFDEAKNTQACTQCTNQSSTTTPYGKCYSCKKKCENIGTASAKDACEKQCMGTELYEKYTKSYSEHKSQIEKEKQEAANDVLDAATSLYKFKINFEGINFKSKYKVKCKDFEALHTIYLILEIAAPIAVIVFGSLDYAKAVMASDIEKMEKSKKKFPKRLLLLVLFVLVPILIQIILKLFSTTSDSIDADTSLMKCIILGK